MVRTSLMCGPKLVQAKFLEEFAHKPGYGYLKRIAVEDKRKNAAQRKKVSVQDPTEVQKRIQELEKNGAPGKGEAQSILKTNEPLAPFLYEGDIVLPEHDAIRLNFTKSFKQNRAGGMQDLGYNRTMEIPKWPHDKPICYRFKQGADPYTMEVARQAFKFWTENSCLTWEENCANKPVIAVHTDLAGCWTTVGRAYRTLSYNRTTNADGTIKDTFAPGEDAEEQLVSLQASGCNWFATAAHEASHVMGMFHEHTRPDRDAYIDIVWSNISAKWQPQYKMQNTSQTYGIPYDYASNMQYSGYPNDTHVDMFAKETMYQHTMGNKYGPIFNDIKFVNTYNDCMCKGGITCQNGGFPHPRQCNARCVCPEGFGGATCADRESGVGQAPPSCGATVQATENWQSLNVTVPAPKGDGPYNLLSYNDVRVLRAVRPSCCTWWIKGNGKKLDIQLESVTSDYECSKDCNLGGTEIKFGDLSRGGARVCCPEHAKEFGAVSTTQDMAIVRVCSLRNTQAAVVKFKTK
ncbi:metalloproteinase [Aphelenchoides avenae]|nr:metalloproteinase [Aphelenchus avenae]